MAQSPNHTPYFTLHKAGFKALLPIIPPDAAISPRSPSLAGREGTKNDPRGKLPGLLRHDGWVGFAHWQDYEADDDDLTDWHEMGAGVGLRCADVVAIDIDVTDPALVKLVQGQVMTHLGFAPVRVGNAPKSLLVFRQPPGAFPSKQKLTFTDYNGVEHAIEILGAAQQFVVDGIHPKTGQPYTWSEPLAEWGLDGLTEVTPEDASLFLSEVSELLTMLDCEVGSVAAGSQTERPAEDLICKDPDLLRRVVDALPNEMDTDREYFISMAHALWGADAGGALGLELYQQWCERWPGGNDPDDVDRAYTTVKGSTIGIGWLMNEAQKHGFNSASDDFGAPVQTRHTPPENDPAVLDDVDFSDDPGDDQFWREWVYVNSIKRFYHTPTGIFLDKENFDDRLVSLGDKDERPSRFFVRHRRPGCWADAPSYYPGEYDRTVVRKGVTYLNQWRPGPAYTGDWGGDSADNAGPADVQPWLDLAEHLIPDDRERGLLFDWMASLLQRPHLKPNWHPLIGSAVHGTGKDSLFAPLVYGLGAGDDGNVTTIRNQDLEGQWSWWAENTQLVVVSEIGSFERRSVMDKLKSYMATPPDTIEINKKGVGQYQIPNRFGMVMFTNRQDAAAIERHDRRFFVIWSEAEQKPDEYFVDYHQWLGAEDFGSHWTGCRAVAQWLMERDISQFSTRGNAPHTEAKETMRKATLTPIEGLIEEGMDLELGPFKNDLFSVQDFVEWLRPQVKGTPPTAQKVAILLKVAGCVALGRIRVGEERRNVWCCRRALMYQGEDSRKIATLYQEQVEASANTDAMRDFA